MQRHKRYLRKKNGANIGFSLMCIAIGICGLVITTLTTSQAEIPANISEPTELLDLSPTESSITDEHSLKILPIQTSASTTGEVITVSADGDISDLLIPAEEYAELEKIDSTNYDFSVSKDIPIVIYHTHTTEAYRMTEGFEYEQSSEWRTEDNSINIVAVGEHLKSLLEGYGYTVIHDTTDHEPPSLSTSYERSVVTMEYYKEKYPESRLFIDLHRDAAGSALVDDYVMVEGKETARLMFVVGTGENYSQKPNYESNFAFADLLTESLEDVATGLTREIRVKTGVSDMCILVEAGHNQNTFEQAMNLMDVFARVLDDNIS